MKLPLFFTDINEENSLKMIDNFRQLKKRHTNAYVHANDNIVQYLLFIPKEFLKIQEPAMFLIFGGAVVIVAMARYSGIGLVGSLRVR